MGNRDNNIDIMKGICIILMVLGHTAFPGTQFIYLFHMPIFFMVAGYCYNDRYSENIHSVLSFIYRRLKSLWIPYVTYNLIYLLLHNLFIKIHFLTDNTGFLDYSVKYGVSDGLAEPHDIRDSLVIAVKILLFGYEEPFAGVAWFLRVLFVISVMYCITGWIFKKFLNNTLILQGFYSILCVFAGYYLYSLGWNFESIGVIFSCYILFYIGKLLRSYVDMDKIYADLKMCIAVTMIMFLILACLNKIGAINLINNEYTNPVFLVIASVSGWCFAYGVSVLLTRWRIEKVFVYLGQNTMPVMFMHFIAFKAVTEIQLIVYDLPQYLLAAHPILISKGWWILYGMAGVVIPVGIINIVRLLKKQILRWSGNSFERENKC